jgi:glycerophosphoryl diester phosphodiesterase
VSRKSPAKAFWSIKRWAGWLGRGSLFLFLWLLLSYGLYFALRRSLPLKPSVIAHRGAHKGKSGHLPENTLAAFRRAIEIGADWLELDVHMTKDGELVVIHDETVDRTTNGTGWVKDLTLDQIRSLDAGQGERIPTFAEVLALAKAAEVRLLPEIKSAHLYPGIEFKIIQAIVEADYIDKTAVQSFEPHVLEAVHALNPAIQVCPLYGPGHLSLQGSQPGEATTVCPMAEMVLLNPWMLRQAHAENRQVFVWFGAIEHPPVIRLLLALGADGLMVDDPQTLIEIMDR